MRTLNAFEAASQLFLDKKVYLIKPVDKNITVAELQLLADDGMLACEEEQLWIGVGNDDFPDEEESKEMTDDDFLNDIVDEITEEHDCSGNIETVDVVKRKPIDGGKILALREAGWSVAKIADEMGCSQGSIYYILNKAKEEQT